MCAKSRASGYARRSGRGVSASGADNSTGGAQAATPQAPAANGFTGTVDGTDISDSWVPPSGSNSARAGQIQSVMDAQGFRGKPRIVTDQAEFDKAVADAWNGNGLVLYRGYSAPDAQTLKDYEDSLRSGEWYVQCSGGAVYGMGMYAGYAYGGKTANGGRTAKNAKSTAEGYAARGRYRGKPQQKVEEMTLHPSAKIGEYNQLQTDMKLHNARITKNRSQAVAARSKATAPLVQQLSTGTRAEKAAATAWQNGKQGAQPRRGTSAKYQTEFNAAMSKLRKTADAAAKLPSRFTDVGTFAAAKGYDFYYDRSSGYSVVLNRTKLIIKD